MLIIQDFNTRFQRISGMPVSSKAGQAKLKQAGINTNSKQYRAVMESMSSGCMGVGYTTVSSIKNRMSRYDKDGDHLNITTGIAGLLVTDENRATMNNIISIPESSREEMFESTKKEFLRENGVHNGDRTNRSNVFNHLYRKMNKKDRLAAGHTLEEYERQYHLAFAAAAKAADPRWEIGQSIKPGALDNVTRESVESYLTQSGHSLVRKSLDVLV